MQSNFWGGSKNLDRHKTFWDLLKDKALLMLYSGTRFIELHQILKQKSELFKGRVLEFASVQAM